MRVLGIDPGLVRTGWALVEPADRRESVSAYGLIQPETNQELQKRLADGARELRKVLAEQKPERGDNERHASGQRVGAAGAGVVPAGFWK